MIDVHYKCGLYSHPYSKWPTWRKKTLKKSLKVCFDKRFLSRCRTYKPMSISKVFINVPFSKSYQFLPVATILHLFVYRHPNPIKSMNWFILISRSQFNKEFKGYLWIENVKLWAFQVWNVYNIFTNAYFLVYINILFQSTKAAPLKMEINVIKYINQMVLKVKCTL